MVPDFLERAADRGGYGGGSGGGGRKFGGRDARAVSIQPHCLLRCVNLLKTSIVMLSGMFCANLQNSLFGTLMGWLHW